MEIDLLLWIVVGVALLALYATIKTKNPLDASLLALTFVILLAILIAKQNKTKNTLQKGQEHYVDWNNFVELVNPNTSNLSEPYAFLQDTYNETLLPIASGLTLYYSVFSKDSYTADSTNWYNISPFFNNVSTKKLCPDVKFEETHLTLATVPTFARDEGIHIGSNTIRGVPCNKLGITAANSFTTFLMFSIMELPQDQQVLPLIKVFAHTMNINGFTIEIGNKGGKPTVSVFFGNETVAKDLTLDDVILKKPLLLVLNKNLQDVSVVFYSNLEAADVLMLRKEKSVQLTAPANDVEFSNKPFEINRDKSLLLNMHAMGFYRVSLTTSKQNDVAVYLAKEHLKMTKYMQQLGNTLLTLQQKAEDAKQCKFDLETCGLCKSVTDWSNIAAVATSANDPCLEAIDKFCSANPEHAFCSCWNTENPVSQSATCQRFVNLFRPNPAIQDIDNIDPDTLSVIREKYKLCKCDNTSSSTNHKGDVVSLPTKRTHTIAINMTDWPISESDIGIFEKIGIDNPYVKDAPMELTLAVK